jgi:deoxycytidine triphosphate deaminase
MVQSPSSLSSSTLGDSHLAQILADKDVSKLLGSVITDADPELINPNGIELRLGKDVLFHSTGEEAELVGGCFLRVSPGESVTISSLETIDFRTTTVHQTFPGQMLMAFITPTTTMMREGISQVSTKIDAGFRGMLNWGLRNGSTKDLILQFGEPIFKATFFLLSDSESPVVPYGERPKDSYQDADGIIRSTRRIPADIPKSKIICSSFDRLDPKKQLREAGYPFDHIGTELLALDGKFELVSSDVRIMREDFQKRTQELSDKIQAETRTLSDKLEDARKSVLQTVESLFDRKFLRVVGVIIGSMSILYGGVTFLQGKLAVQSIAFVATIVGISVIVLSYLIAHRAK